jgi:hypothetical protein
MSEPIFEGVKVLQDCVRTGRKMKSDAKVSFKDRPFLVRFKIPFAIMFSWHREDNEEIIRRMLRADAIYLEEECFDSLFELSEQIDRFPCFSGCSELDGIRGQLWTESDIWI